MAITYKVKVSRKQPETGGFQKGAQADEIQTNWSVNYEVTVSDPADQNFDPVEIQAFNVLFAPGLPVVNQTAYYDPITETTNPYLICRTKKATRVPSRADRWNISTTWDTGSNATTTESQNQPQGLPDALTDISPRYEYRLGESELVRFTDKDGKACKTPTGNLWDEPFVERVPVWHVTVRQYQQSILYADMFNRKFKINSAAWDGQAIHNAMIMDVQATNVTIELAAGPTVAALVTYELEYTTRPGGWLDQRALIDTHYLDAGQKTAFLDDKLQTFITGNVGTDGAIWLSEDPQYDEWRMQDEVDFNSFIQPPV